MPEPVTGREIQPQRHLELAKAWEALEWCENQIALGLTAPQVARLATKDPPEGLGMPRSTANRYVGAVLARLQSNAAVEPADSKKARLEAFWHGQIKRALAHKRVVETPAGPVVVDSPNLSAANQAGQALMVLLGVEK